MSDSNVPPPFDPSQNAAPSAPPYPQQPGIQQYTQQPAVPPYAPYPGGMPPGYAPLPPQKAPALAIIAIVFAVLISPLGLILAIIALATAKGRKSAKMMGWVALGLSIVVTAAWAIGIVWMVNTTNAAERVSTDFVKDLQQGNATSAYALTSPGFRTTTSQSDLTNFIAADSANLQGTLTVTTKAMQASTTMGEMTEIQYRLVGPTELFTIQVQMVKSGGSWRVEHFEQTRVK